MTIQDRFRFRAWDNQNNKYIYDVEYTYDNSQGDCFSDIIEGTYGSFSVEQCTGLKDMNSKLIYEGDIVDIWVVINIQGEIDRRRGKVYWSEEDACFSIYVALDEEYPLYGQDIYIIGNIHENADLLENKDE